MLLSARDILKGRISSLLLCLNLFVLVSGKAQQIAFPGAEGAGKFTSGGRGTASVMTTVFEVTNLTDVNSPGSLRYACSQSTVTYPYRTIVFRVSGTIHLNSKLNIPGNTTIAGQTAPGDGICLADYPVNINGDNVIVRYIRCRLGDKNQLKTTPVGCGIPVAPFTAACMPLDGSGGDDALGNLGNKNLIIDHCSVSWSNDEALTVYRGDSVTMQWNIISEPLNYSYHFEAGDTDFEHHGYGGIWGSLHGSFHHNLIAHCRNRNPRFAGNSAYSGAQEAADFRNNVIYNWGINSIYGGEGGNYNLINNFFKYGPSTGSGVKYRIVGVDSNVAYGYAKYYLSGNYVDGSTANTNNNWLGAAMNTGNQADTVKSKVNTPFLTAYFPSITHTALQAYDSVLKYAGCIVPNRDTLDQRIINNVKNRTGAIIDCQGGYPHATPYAQTVNAWPTLNSAVAPADSDHDGMPDTWEITNGLNPNNGSDRGQFATNGYTNLENYLNSITSTINTNVDNNPATATWTLLTDQSPSIAGNLTATNQTLGSFLAGIQYNSTFGGISGWQRVGSISSLPIGYSSDSYLEYKITPSNGKRLTINSIELSALGGGTGTAKMAIYYSLDNFNTSFPAGICTYNGTAYDATISSPVSLITTSTSSLTGQQVASIPTLINVGNSQTLSIRIYVWITGSGNRYFASQNVKIDGISSDIALTSLITSLSVNSSKKVNQIFWSVANEINVDKYILESSLDGFNFSYCGQVKALNLIRAHYDLIDNVISDKTVYYRLKIINKDASFSYSFIVLTKPIPTENLKVYPNPTTSYLTLQFLPFNKATEVRIYTTDGRKIKTISLTQNTSQSTFSVESLAKGTYYLQIVSDNRVHNSKFIKQ